MSCLAHKKPLKMSQFGGLMKEYPQVALDRFQGPGVLKARAYFLSHFHAGKLYKLSLKGPFRDPQPHPLIFLQEN